MSIFSLPTFTFEWVKEGRSSRIKIGKEFIPEEDRFWKGEDHLVDTFLAKAGKQWRQR